MQTQEQDFRLKINAYTPQTIPMSRLAEYMAQFAALLGEKDNVHFVGLKTGSTVLAASVQQEAVPKVRQRLVAACNNADENEARKAIKELNRMLKDDNGYAVLLDGGAKIIEFPGVRQFQLPVFGPVTQNGTLDGVIIRIGGKNDLVPLTLQTRDGHEAPKCYCSRDLAKDLARYLFGEELRLSGVGRWTRPEDGVWLLNSFTVTSFEQLDQQNLSDAVADLRAVTGSGWSGRADPWGDLKQIRGED